MALYELWDWLIEENPGLWIDNCASGGRRIDLETTMRSLPLHKSDAVYPHRNMIPQLHNQGLSLYLPVHSRGGSGLEPSYAFRSVMQAGNVFGFRGTSVEKIRETVEAYKRARPYFEGDFYPLFKYQPDETAWYAYQLHLPDEERGMVVAFRRKESADVTRALSLRELDVAGTYTVENKDEQRTETMSGEELRSLAVTIDEQPGSRLLFYEKE